MIIDASAVIDAVADPGPRGTAAIAALAAVPAAEPMLAPGHFAFEVMSGLRAAAHRPGYPFGDADIESALRHAERLGIAIESTPWVDVHRGWELARGSLRYADAVYVGAAERHGTVLLTADAKIESSRAPVRCQIHTVTASGIMGS